MKFAVYVTGKMMRYSLTILTRGGANEASLRQAQKNFIAFGACEECCVGSVRKPTSEDVKDASWKHIC